MPGVGQGPPNPAACLTRASSRFFACPAPRPLLFSNPAAGKDGQPAPSKYDLVANLVHEGKAGQGQGTYRVHVHRKASEGWLGAQGAASCGWLGAQGAASCGWLGAQGAASWVTALVGRWRLCCAAGSSQRGWLLVGGHGCRSSPALALFCCLPQVEEQWYEVQDLRVTEVLPQMVALSETYAQVYELKQ